ncbi:hypothetical protein [Nonomuraea sp. NPDC023979]|uniref:hypothetical protein n=1 Tax=Nonomuraea sp. NPDC023979 TaxID=3154796 RepID=UPI0033C72433
MHDDVVYPAQLDRQDLAGMTHEAIHEAYQAGQLNALMETGNYVRDRSQSEATQDSGGESQLEALRAYKRLVDDPKQFVRDVLAEGPPQLTRSDLQRMTHEEINAARLAGQLNDLLGVAERKPA